MEHILLNPLAYLKKKILIDKLLAFSGLFLSAPIMLLCGLAIRISSRGPVFFKQERLGMNEKPFVLIKFRSMIDNAEKETGPKWAGEDDPRITPVGKFLRKTRLDELPQLFNVLRGEMSVVGPRPIRKHFADILAQEIPNYRLRFAVKPGITGWAQVCGDYAGSHEGQRDKFQYDLYYIQNQSVLFDCLILLKTVKTVILQKGQ
jgi:exopolysaccharide biosynthesis polyprenyl glycosylphosphotransferase